MIRFFALVKIQFLELLRERIFLVTVFLGVVLLLLSLLLGALSFNEQARMVSNFGFLGVFLSAMMLATYFGSYGLHREMEKQTLLLILARAISRKAFLVSRLVSSALFIGFQIFLLTVLVTALVSTSTTQFLHGLQIGVGIWLQALFVLAFATASALVVRPALSFVLSWAVCLLSFWIQDLQFFAEKSRSQMLISLADGIGYLLPRFDRTNWKSYYFIENGILASDFATMILHLAMWSLLWIAAGALLFRRRDLV